VPLRTEQDEEEKNSMAMTKMSEHYESIRAGIVDLLKSAESAAARNVNLIMTAVYWDIGRRIVESEQRRQPSGLR